MKIILREDIKNKGKKNDIIITSTGYANYLISAGKAIICSDENLSELVKIRRIEVENEAALRAEANTIAQTLNTRSFLIKAAATPKGTLKNSITKEDVLKLINSNGIRLSKTQLEMNVIKTFGQYEIGINLYKDIKCSILLGVEEDR